MFPRHLYVHVPFCTRRCSYCDFSIAVRRTVPVEEYVTGVRAEIDQKCSSHPPLPLDTLYLGGGTPSRLGADGISRLIDVLRKRFELGEEAEVTLEANPEDVSVEAARAWIAAGINRISLGVQSFDDAVLGWMHRSHDATDAARSVMQLREAGVANLSLDLIFALPAEIARSWKSDLDKALALRPDHISLYGLTVERGTPLARWNERNLFSSPDDDRYAADFLLADAIVTDAGYRHYEVSSFAVPGRESRHNSAYWSGATYLGIGPSAHSFDGMARRWNVRHYRDWLHRVMTGRTAIEGEELLDESNRGAEKVYLGLRTDNGYLALPAELAIARRWESAGWASIESNRVRLTAEGWLRLDALAAGLTGF